MESLGFSKCYLHYRATFYHCVHLTTTFPTHFLFDLNNLPAIGEDQSIQECKNIENIKYSLRYVVNFDDFKYFGIAEA